MAVDEQTPKSEKQLKKITKKSALHTKKSATTVKSPEKTLSCEFEEETAAGEKAKHRYSLSFSDPYSIKKQIEVKKFSLFQEFQLNLEALQIKHTGKIDR